MVGVLGCNRWVLRSTTRHHVPKVPGTTKEVIFFNGTWWNMWMLGEVNLQHNQGFNHTSNASWTGGTEVFAVVCGDVAVVGLPFLGNKRMELFGTSQRCFLLETTWFHSYKGCVGLCNFKDIFRVFSRSDLLSFVWKLVLLKKVPLDQGVSVCVPITATKPILKVRTIAVPNPRRSNHQKKGFTIWSCRLHKKNATYFCHLFPASLERGIYIISKKRIPSWPSRVMSTLANKIGSFPQVDGKGHGYGPDGSWW